MHGNTNMVLKSVTMFSLYLVPYFLMITGVITHPAGLFLLWIIMGFGMAGIGLSVMHDANHKSYSKNQAINRMLSYSLNLLGGFSQTWQYQHNTLHHGYTNIDGYDEDIDPGRILRFSPYKPRYRIHKYQHYYAWFLYGLMTVTWTIDKDFKQLLRYHHNGNVLGSNKSLASRFIELIISKLVYYLYILVVPILVLPVPWWMVIIFYLSMHFICGIFLATIFVTAHVMPTSKYPVPDADGTIDSNWAIHQLETTTDYSPRNRWFSWFIGGLNYQIEHHLFPNICHVHYRQISLLVESTARSYNVPYHVRANFFLAVRDHFRMLKILGR